MYVLHVEDYNPTRGIDYAKQLSFVLKQNNSRSLNVENVADVKKLNLHMFNLFVIDGFFPEEENMNPDISSFFQLIEFFQMHGIGKEKLIVWSNGTRIHEYCFENSITYFSKDNYTMMRYKKNGINPIVKAQKADAKIICKKLNEIKNII